jgi:hypothetical protein
MNQMTKKKSKKRSLKPNSTSDLVLALRVITEYTESKPISNDDKVIICFLLNEVADRMSALVDLTVRQNKRIQELEASK